MEKRKEKADLEQLLNSLIDKGWKPRNIECKSVKSTDHCLEFYTELKTIGWIMKDERQLVSKESGLWQFCCENGMVDGADRWTLNARQKSIYDKYITSEKEYTPKMNYQYRLIESALCDEDKLEEFLLNSIKLD